MTEFGVDGMNERRKVLELFEQQKAYTQEITGNNIEKYRKTDATITVKGKDGKPVTNARISVKQTGHAFKYGANLFMLDELESDEKNQRYREIMASFGNMATLPFYWDATEPEKGKTRYEKDSVRLYRRPPIDLCMEFCKLEYWSILPFPSLRDLSSQPRDRTWSLALTGGFFTR